MIMTHYRIAICSTLLFLILAGLAGARPELWPRSLEYGVLHRSGIQTVRGILLWLTPSKTPSIIMREFDFLLPSNDTISLSTMVNYETRQLKRDNGQWMKIATVPKVVV